MLTWRRCGARSSSPRARSWPLSAWAPAAQRRGAATCRPNTSASTPSTRREGGRGVTVDANERAQVLVEALPYIKRFHGQTVVIKVGGNAIDHSRDETLLDVVLLRYVGMQPVLVHGGGPEITAMSERLGLKAEFKNGLRVTDETTME